MFGRNKQLYTDNRVYDASSLKGKKSKHLKFLLIAVIAVVLTSVVFPTVLAFNGGIMSMNDLSVDGIAGSIEAGYKNTIEPVVTELYEEVMPTAQRIFDNLMDKFFDILPIG